MRRVKSLVLFASLLAASTAAAGAEINVVVSIKPLHSLVASVMKGAGEPGLIVEGAASPHTYSLKPSQAAMLEKADLVFWVGHELEAFLEKPLETLASKAKSVELIDASDLVKLPLREGGPFEKHGHGGDGHDDHAQEAQHDHDHEKPEETGHGGHDHGAFDAHVWLDPVNAKAMVHEIAEALIEADPANKEKYAANAADLMQRLDALRAEIAAQLEPVRGKGFIVFHDAYQYFENRFGVPASGSITVSPEVMPGAERVTEIRKRVKELGAACVFAEPQFESKLVATVTEGTNARTGVLDPEGGSLDPSQDLYFKLLRNLSTSVRDCLTRGS